LLAGYSIGVAMSIEDCFNSLITDQKESLFTHSKESKIISFILESKETTFLTTDLCRNKHCLVGTLKKLLKSLIDLKLGVVIDEKNSSGPTTKLFAKHRIAEISMEVLDFLQENGVDLDIFKELNGNLIETG